MKNKDYTVQELIHNQSFRRMVNGTADNEEIRKWNKWIEADERNREKARKALSQIAGFQFVNPKIPDVSREWETLRSHTLKKGNSHLSAYHRKFSTFKWIYRVVAILILGAVMGAGFYFFTLEENSSAHLAQITEERTVSMESGEHKTVRFSNGSKIILNRNSEVTYSIREGQPIKVVVEGEAFFDAENKAESDQPVFAVNTPDGVIMDIGTEFMVTVERDRSRVVLEEGEVEIRRKHNDGDNRISMTPGEMVEFNKSQVLNKRQVNSSFYTSWATGSMSFDNTTVQKFAGFVEQRFGVTVQIVDEDLSDIRIDGGIYFRSLEELVRSVSEIADLPVYQSKNRDTVYIGDQH